MTGFSEMERRTGGAAPLRLAVAGGSAIVTLTALKRAADAGWVTGLLVGEEEKTAAAVEDSQLKGFDIVSAKDDAEASALAVDAVRSGRVDVLMKGTVSTPILLKAVLAEKTVFSRGDILSHAVLVESPQGRRLIITDAGINIKPDLERKAAILVNAVKLAHRLNADSPRVAVLAALEKENPAIPESVDAAALKRRWEEGTFADCVVEGPISLDLAVIPEAAERKGWKGRIRGDADILLTHDLSSGNYLAKALIQLAGWKSGGMVLGAGRPILLSSRSDESDDRYHSLLLAFTILERENHG